MVGGNIIIRGKLYILYYLSFQNTSNSQVRLFTSHMYNPHWNIECQRIFVRFNGEWNFENWKGKKLPWTNVRFWNFSKGQVNHPRIIWSMELNITKYFKIFHPSLWCFLLRKVMNLTNLLYQIRLSTTHLYDLYDRKFLI